MAYLSGRTGEQQEIAVGIAHDEIPRAPRLLLERPEEVDAGCLVLQEELLDLGRAVDRHRGAEQLLAFADVAGEDRLADHAEIEQRLVPPDLAIEWRLAVGEDDLEAQLGGEVAARGRDVGDEQLG